MLWETSYLFWGTVWWDWCATTQWRWRTSRTRGARDRTLWCRWPFDCSSGATARRLRWFPSICQEFAISRRIPCPESARLWPRSGRWPWRVYDQCLPSGANHRSICLRHSPTDDSSSSFRHIRTPGRSGQTCAWEGVWPKLVTSGRQIFTRGNSQGHSESQGSFQGSCQHDVKMPTRIFTTSVWISLVKIRGVL